MQLFGSGNETKEEVESVVMAVEDIKAHVNALDNAVQHHDKEIDEIISVLTAEREIVEDVQALKKVFRKFSNIQSDYIERVDVLDSEISKTNRKLSKTETKVKKLKKSQNALFEEIDRIESKFDQRIDALEDKIDKMEGEIIVNTNRQEWDIETKVEKSEFESHQDKVDEELSKLRASLNDLSDKIEDEKVEIEN